MFLMIVLLFALILEEPYCRSHPLDFFRLDSLLSYDIIMASNVPETIAEFKHFSSFLTISYSSKNDIGNFAKHPGRSTILIFTLTPAEEYEYDSSPNLWADFNDSNANFCCVFIILPDFFNSTEIMNLLSKLVGKDSLTVDSNIFVILDNGEARVTSLWEMYVIKDSTFASEFNISTEGIVISDVLAKLIRRNDFQGAEITGIATRDEDYEAEAKYSNETGTLKFESGFAVNLYRDLKIMLNFSEVALPGSWMSVSNNTVQGSQAYALIRNKADICIAQNVMRPDLATFVLFLQPTYPISVIAFFLEPTYGRFVEIYHAPFDLYVWVAILVAVFGLSVLINIFVAIFSSYSDLVEKRDEQLATESLIWAIGTATQKGWHIFPRSLSLRLIVFTGSLAAVVSYGAYSAALVSKLSIKISPIQSFRDLLYYDYKIIFSNNSVSLREYAKGLKSYYKIRKINGYGKDDTDFLTDLMHPYSAYLNYWDGIQHTYPVTNQFDFICKSLQAFPVENTLVHTGMTLKKGSPFKETFNHKILLLKERGYNHRYAKYYAWETQPQCLPKSNARHDPLDLSSIFSGFLLLLAGFGVASILLPIEIILKARTRRFAIIMTSEDYFPPEH